MSDITELSTKEKSVLLAKAMGWRKERRDVGYMIFLPDGSFLSHGGGCLFADWPNFYHKHYMWVAWRVLAWAKRQLIADDAPPDWVSRHMDLWHVVADNMGEPEAQTWWLDECLELAIEDGSVQLEDATA